MTSTLETLEGELIIIWTEVFDSQTPVQGLGWYQGRSVVFVKSEAIMTDQEELQPTTFVLHEPSPAYRALLKAEQERFRANMGYMRDYNPRVRDRRFASNMDGAYLQHTPSEELAKVELTALGTIKLEQIKNLFPHVPVPEEVWAEVESEA